MDSTRREFLHRAIQLAIATSTLDLYLPRIAFADDKEKRAKGKGPGSTLVVIFLRGGCDPLNIVVPFGDPLYYKYRPTIQIAPKDQGTERGAIALNKHFGFHPALEALMPLYEAGTLAPILNVGSPHPSRSHFDCMDFMEYAAPGDRTVTQGWLNRYLEGVAAAAERAAADPDSRFRAVAMQGLLPRALRGAYPVLAVPPLREGGASDPLDAFDEVYIPAGGMPGEMEPPPAAPPGAPPKADPRAPKPDPKAPAPPAPPAEDPVLLSGRNTIEAIRRFREIVSKPAPGEKAGRYPQAPFGQQLRQLARVIKADCGLEVGCLDYHGWDHHAREGGTDGVLAPMLKVLGDGLAAFAEDLGPERMARTIVLTMSEFGRTVEENGNAGTDHGHGGIMFALGGPVKGGKVFGTWPGLAKKDLFEERDLPATTDFRLVFGEVLEGVFGWRPPADFFPNYRLPKKYPLQLIKPG